MTISIDFELSYGQLAVFASSLKHPFNDWTDKHVLQGFAWRPGSVSFRSLLEAGRHSVEVRSVDHLGQVHQDAVRVIDVPFEVPDDGAVEIGSISETFPVSLPSGSFLLRCEFLKPDGNGMGRVELTFSRMDKPRFAIVRADQEVSGHGELLTTAQPAGG